MTRPLSVVNSNAGRHNGASQKVLEYLRKNPNLLVPYSEIERALDMPESTVSNAVGHLTRTGVAIERPMRGSVIYRPIEMTQVKKEVPKLYEYVGTSGSQTIVRGEDNELYRIVALFER